MFILLIYDLISNASNKCYVEYDGVGFYFDYLFSCKIMSSTKENTVHVISVEKSCSIKTLKAAILSMVTERAEVKRITVFEKNNRFNIFIVLKEPEKVPLVIFNINNYKLNNNKLRAQRGRGEKGRSDVGGGIDFACTSGRVPGTRENPLRL